MSGNVDKLKGKTKQAIGKAIDNKELQAKGKAQEAKGSVKKTGEKLVDKTDDAI